MPPTTKAPPRSKRTRVRARKPVEARLSRLRKPGELDASDWQVRLRRQFGREQSFELDNLGSDPVFSEFVVSNPQSQSRYRVAIRGAALGDNFCSCADFATNDLGTCKHIEFALARIESRRGAKAALRRGFEPPYSEIWLRYGGARALRFRAGTDCPPALAQRGTQLFGDGVQAALAASAAAELERLLAAAHQAGHEMRCYDDARAFIAEARDRGTRQRILDDAYPKGAKDAKLARIAQGQALSLPGRRRVVRGARRPCADRRRDGARQDAAGDRRRRVAVAASAAPSAC